MPHSVIFYPVGNGDTSQIVLQSGKRILFDFRHLKKGEGVDTPEIDLKKRLKEELDKANKSYFDIVAFTHGDQDHIEGSTEFFELNFAEKYQGEGRIKIKTLWVPAAMILETTTNDKLDSEFIIWRQEARYRLKKGEGIRVFSKPDRLKEWLKENNLSVESRKHLITDAGEIVPGFSLETDGVEFFCHSPFIKHVDKNEEFRNEAALVFNVRFKLGNERFDYLAVGDSKWDILDDIVKKSKKHNNVDRIRWDLFNIPHHCSAYALNEEKGDEETEPTDHIRELLEFGNEGAYLISSSNPILNTKESYEQSLPPHIQAKKCYERYLKKVNGCKFLVTMEEPNRFNPEPIVISIDESGLSYAKQEFSAQSIIISKPAKAG
ncbi:hypothetical protein [Leptospira kmetyi]|uniref:hypothetical protein n=1 Tax=Leptospira kmetyi TaxID=408139 RepID=UPI0010835C3E|nr:hypothetical protein [Leptospira kmetyi]TGK23373.1 hypothetical protein EHO62_00020 [Leptospira kmetyi]TGK34409.1 hypothetical protein EHO66_00595 [Leptospira kmetyi]